MRPSQPLKLIFAILRALVVRDCVSPSLLIQQLAKRWLGWLPNPSHRPLYAKGFTLPELLIALASWA